MADAAGEHEEVEDGVHEAALAHGVEDGTGDEADALGYNPDDCRWVYAVDEGLEGYEHAQSHRYVADGLQIAVSLQRREALYGARDGGSPDEGDERPTPVAVLAQGYERDGRIGACYVPVDSGVVPLAQTLFPGRPCRESVIDGGGDVAREHTEEVEYHAGCSPAVARPAAPHEQRRAYDQAEDNARTMRPRIPKFFLMIEIDFHTLLC